MSLPDQNLQPVQLLSSKYDFIREAKVGTRIGNESRSKIKYAPINQTKITGPQSQTFQVSNESFFDSDIKMEVQYSFVISGDDGTSPVKIPVDNVNNAFKDKFGLSSFAYNRCISNISVRLNNSSILTTNVADTLDAFIYGENADFLATLSPVSKLDNYYTFGSTLSNVLRNGEDVIDQVDSRGLATSYDVSIIENPLNTNKILVTITMQESIIARPFQYHSKDRNPFFNINELQMIINYESDLTKFLKFSESVLDPASYTPVITGLANVKFSDFTIKNSLIINSFTPQIQVERPRKCFWNTPIINTFKAEKQTLTTGQTLTQMQQFNNYVINGIPKLFIVYVKAVEITTVGVKSVNRGESFASIKGLQFSFDNKVNQFIDLSIQQDLYEMSIKNGYNQRFGTFAGLKTSTGNTGAGSLFYFRPEDLNMNSAQMSNVNGSFNIQLKVLYSNPHSETITFEPTLALVYDNILMWDGNSFSDFKPLINPQEAVSAPLELTNDSRVMNSIMGGSWWSDAWDTVKKVVTNPVTKEISKFARNTPWLSKHLGDDTQVGKFLGKHGYGQHGEHEEHHGGMYGRTQTHSNKGGSSMVIGGKKLSKKQLLDML